MFSIRLQFSGQIREVTETTATSSPLIPGVENNTRTIEESLPSPPPPLLHVIVDIYFHRRVLLGMLCWLVTAPKWCVLCAKSHRALYPYADDLQDITIRDELHFKS